MKGILGQAVAAQRNNVAVRLDRLAKMGAAAPRVLSVYVDTRWVDEHQRDRLRGAGCPRDLAGSPCRLR